MDNKQHLRAKLKAKIEANRISRLPRDKQDDILDDYRVQHRKAKGWNKERLKIMIDIIEERQEQADEAYYNQTYAEYNDGYENGGGGAGTDNG